MTTIQTSIKYDRDSRDFAVIIDDQIFGWRVTAAGAEELLNETVTRITALRAQADDTPACRTCGGPVEIDGDECDDCCALCCEACGDALEFEDAHLLGANMVCSICAAQQFAHVEAMAALAAADERREYRESLALAGQAEDAQRMATALSAGF